MRRCEQWIHVDSLFVSSNGPLKMAVLFIDVGKVVVDSCKDLPISAAKLKRLGEKALFLCQLLYLCCLVVKLNGFLADSGAYACVK